MRSIFAKLAIVTFVTLGFITQETEARSLKNLVQHSATGNYETNMMPTRFASVLLGATPAPAPSSAQAGPPAKNSTASPSEPSKNSPASNQGPSANNGQKPEPPRNDNGQKPEASKNGTAPASPSAPVQASASNNVQKPEAPKNETAPATP